MSEEETRIRGSDVNNSNRDIFDNDYNFEIDLSKNQKILVIILNLLSGGLGTMIVPFLNKKKNKRKKTLIVAGIVFGIMQIFHVLHFFSLLNKVPFIEKLYERIVDDDFLTKFIWIKKNDINSNDQTNMISDNDSNDNSSFFAVLMDNLSADLSTLIMKKKRKKVLKYIFGFISGLSYGNSLFTALINLLEYNNSPNKVLAIKIVFYSIFNPGAGIILNCFLLFPSCDCEKKKYDYAGIFSSIVGIVFGIFILFCPVLLGIGTFLIKITDNMFTIFPLKITLIFIGVSGTIISLLFSGINYNTIIEAVKVGAKREIKPLEILCRCGEDFQQLVSDFGIGSLGRLILNMIIPGSGTIFLQCKYGCNAFIVLVSILQFAIGGMFFFSSIYLLLFHESFSSNYESFFNKIFEISKKSYIDDDIIAGKVFNLFYTYGLCFYFSGFYIILILDYIENIKEIKPYATYLTHVVLTLLTGGLGFTLFFPAFVSHYNLTSDLKIILGFIVFIGGGFFLYGGFVYCLFFWSYINKASKVCFPLFYIILNGTFDIANKIK